MDTRQEKNGGVSFLSDSDTSVEKTQEGERTKKIRFEPRKPRTQTTKTGGRDDKQRERTGKKSAEEKKDQPVLLFSRSLSLPLGVLAHGVCLHRPEQLHGPSLSTLLSFFFTDRSFFFAARKRLVLRQEWDKKKLLLLPCLLLLFFFF